MLQKNNTKLAINVFLKATQTTAMTWLKPENSSKMNLCPILRC